MSVILIRVCRGETNKGKPEKGFPLFVKVRLRSQSYWAFGVIWLFSHYSTPFIIFFSNGQRQKRRIAAAPAMTAKSVKKSVRLVI